jgi:glycosyltransferase involved in cell wall biosynthesis
MSPLVIQEAFSAGLPVIASNVYGNAEQIKHGVNGLLFKFNNSEDLLKQLQRCIDEKDLLRNLSNNILPPRSFEEVANEHIKLYNSLLS